MKAWSLLASLKFRLIWSSFLSLASVCVYIIWGHFTSSTLSNRKSCYMFVFDIRFFTKIYISLKINACFRKKYWYSNSCSMFSWKLWMKISTLGFHLKNIFWTFCILFFFVFLEIFHRIVNWMNNLSYFESFLVNLFGFKQK